MSTYQRLLHPSALLLLATAFVTGGNSIGLDGGDLITQTLALPVLLLALFTLPNTALPWQTRWLLPCLAALGPLTIATQWGLSLTSTPWATERALYTWLPPVAAFLACVALPVRLQRQGLTLIVTLAIFNLILAMLQLAAPQDSPLNFFPARTAAFNGVFANQNHQATLLCLAAIALLAPSLARPSLMDANPQTGETWLAATRIALAFLLLVAIPLTGSRAMALIALIALLILPLVSGWIRRHWQRHRLGPRLLMLAAGGAGFLLLLASTLGWMRLDRLQERRAALREATVEMAIQAMPGGTGAGSFVPWFQAHQPDTLLQWEYYNHAHNEYVQWWLEGGVAGLGWTALLLLGFCFTHPRRDKDGHRPDPAWVASWLGLGCVLAHSFVDYPLRTPALATLCAWLAGIVSSFTLHNRMTGRQALAVVPPRP